MSFRQRLQRALDLVEGIGAATYRPPSNVQELMADFYSVMILEAGGSRYAPSHRRDLLEYELDHVKQVLVPHLRQHLLDMAGYSVCCELRHLFDACDLIDPSYNPEHIESVKLGMLERHGVSAEFAVQLKELAEENKRPDRMSIDTEDEVGCVRAGAILFNDRELQWDESFGGPPWALACKTWLQLQQARNLSDQAIYCDKLYSCEHNSGSLLDKNPEYRGTWLHHLLDLKRDANDPEQLLRYASGHVRRLGMMLLREKYGRGWDAKHGPAGKSKRLSQEYAREVAQQLARELGPLFDQVEQVLFKPTDEQETTVLRLYAPGTRLVAMAYVSQGSIRARCVTGHDYEEEEFDATADDGVARAVAFIGRNMTPHQDQ